MFLIIGFCLLDLSIRKLWTLGLLDYVGPRGLEIALSTHRAFEKLLAEFSGPKPRIKYSQGTPSALEVVSN